jgi:hypothetical protein
MLLFVLALAIAIPLAAGIFFASDRYLLQLRRLWQALRAHPLVTWLLILYGVTVGIFLVTGFYSPTEWLLLGFPVAAGFCAGWWELRRDAAGAYMRVLDQGVLVGLLATTLPVLIMIVGDMWLAWQTGWYVADPEREAMGIPSGWGALLGEELLWSMVLLGVGIILGVIGAFVGAWLATLRSPSRRGGPQQPSPQG